MSHEDLLACTRQQLDLMKVKMMDTKARPQLRDQGKPRYNKPADEWVDKKKEKREANKKKPCPNCKDGIHRQQECDDVKFPVIHESCWMCDVYGHSACNCRYYRKVGGWEKNFDNRCKTAVKDNRVVYCNHSRPLTGPQKMIDKYELGRRLRGEGEMVLWTPAQLEIRRNNKATEQAKMRPIMQKIRDYYATLLPDAA